LKKFASVDLENNAVWIDVLGQASKRIGDMEFADLATPGMEHFYTRTGVYKIISIHRERFTHLLRTMLLSGTSYYPAPVTAAEKISPTESGPKIRNDKRVSCQLLLDCRPS
jgi:hypothetical protein